MSTRTFISTMIIGLAIATLPLASAQNGLDGNIIVQLGVAGASTDDIVSNDADVYQDDGEGYSVANCQWILSVNAVVINIAEVESLGVIDDDDLIELAPLLGRINSLGAPWWLERANDTVDSTSDCAQSAEHIRIVVDTDDGWGAPAPMAFATPWSPQAAPTNGIGLGGLNVIEQLLVSEAHVDDVIHNDWYSDQDYGTGFAAANCQLIVAWNTLVANAARTTAVGVISDEDNTTLVDRVVTLPLAEKLAEPSLILDPPYIAPNHATTATAHCTQTIGTLTIIIGDDDHDDRYDDKLPPQS